MKQMNKNKLMKLLANYKPMHKEEEEFKEQIIDFLNNNEVFLGKGNKDGHITGSSWIVSSDRKKALLTYHRKLNKWLQLGGHTEEDEDIQEAALREAKEESGLLNVKCLSEKIFDIDVHMIPERKDEKEHFHYDIRFIFEADDEEILQISSESKDLKWVSLEQINSFSESKSILRMVEKTQELTK